MAENRPDPSMNDRIWSIQYLRALAALGVVFFHAMQAYPWKFAVGAAGVDIFFVISGFIMALLALGRESSPGTFLWRRIIRIVPLCWLVTLLIAGILLIQPLAFNAGDPSFGNVSLSLLFVPHVADGVAPVVMQGWTLEYEMFFYLLVVAALFAPARFSLWLVCGAIGLLAIVGVMLPRPDSPVWSVYTSLLLLEFVFGIGLAIAWKRNWLPPPLVGLVAIALGFAGHVLFYYGVIPPAPHRFLYFGIPAPLIVGGALSLEAGGKVGRSRFGALLGDASYSLYLTHTLPLAILGWFWPEMDLWLYLPLAIGGSIALAITSYILIERPITNALKTVWTRKKASQKPGSSAPESLRSSTP
jgi:exopolysaccharide production protein ExoZ